MKKNNVEENFKEEKHLRKTLEGDTASHAVYSAEQGRRIALLKRWTFCFEGLDDIEEMERGFGGEGVREADAGGYIFRCFLFLFLVVFSV